MPTFRQKPLEVEAFQLTPDNYIAVEQWPEWLREAEQKHMSEVGAMWRRTSSHCNHPWMINTLEGQHVASMYDYIVQGVEGEIYPCKPHIFELTYEMVEATKDQEVVTENFRKHIKEIFPLEGPESFNAPCFSGG